MMFLKNFKIIAIVLFAGVVDVHAQSMRHLSLENIFELGVASSLRVEGSKVSERMAVDNVSDRRAARLPDINVGVIGGYSGTPTIFNSEGAMRPSTATHWSQNYAVELSQPIYRGGILSRSIDKASLQQQIAALGVDKEVADVKLILAGNYLDLLRLYKQRDVIRQSIAQARERLRDIRNMERDGIVTASDVLRSELQLSNYELALTGTTNDITILSTRIDIALGLDQGLIIVPDTMLLQNRTVVLPVETYLDMAYKQYPELQIARSNIDLARTESKIVQSEYFPQISFRASNILARPITTVSPALDLYADNWNVALSLSYNLSSLYHSHQKMRMAKQNIAFQNIEQQKVVQQIQDNVKTSYIKHDEALQKIRTLEISVSQANENYRIVFNKYRNHIAILTDLLDAGTLQLEAQLQLTTARTTALYTYYQLLRASGNL